MKKIYTKPSLHAEKFAVEGIMTEANPLSSIKTLYLNGNVVEVDVTAANSLGTINYSDLN